MGWCRLGGQALLISPSAAMARAVFLLLRLAAAAALYVATVAPAAPAEAAGGRSQVGWRCLCRCRH